MLQDGYGQYFSEDFFDDCTCHFSFEECPVHSGRLRFQRKVKGGNNTSRMSRANRRRHKKTKATKSSS